MKTVKSIVLFLVAIISFNGFAQQPSLHGFKIKSGIIEYTFNGDFTGSEVYCFDNFGSFESIQKRIFINSGNNLVSDTKTVITPVQKITINMENDSVIATESGGAPAIGTAVETQKLLEAGNFKKSGKEMIAGLMCDKYQGDFGKLWIWKGIVLKSQIKVMNKNIIMTAVRVDTLTPVDKKKFYINN